MKKRGSILVNVLIACSLLMLLGSAISIGVINTIKLNQKYSDVIDLELAAKSGLNIFKEELLSEIKSKENSKDLPSGTEEIHSGIDSFDNITITKEIKKEEITVEGTLTGYKYTIISTAKYKAAENAEESTLTKTASQVINVNLKNNESSDGEGGNNGTGEGDIGDIEIEPVNFINVTYKINIQNSKNNLKEDKENIASQVSVGEGITFGWGFSDNDKVMVEPNEDLKILNISLNNSAIEDSIKVDTNVDTNSPNMGSSDINKYLNNGKIYINNENIRFDSINFQGDLVITLNNSKLVVAGDIYASGNITIIMNGNSEIYTNKIQAANALNIEMNNGKIVVTGNDGILSDNSDIYLDIENNSTLYAKKIQAAKKLNIVMDNYGEIIVEGDIYSNSSTIDLTIENNSKLYTKKIQAANALNIVINNYGKIIIEGDIYSNNSTIVLTIKNNSILYSKNKVQSNGELKLTIKGKSNVFIGMNIYSPKGIGIDLDNSNIILGFNLDKYNLSQEILGNSLIELKSISGVCIINGSIGASGGIVSELENSAMICTGKLTIHGGISRFINNGNSFILISGRFMESYISKLEIESNKNTIIPTDKNVINTINKYLNIN